MTSLNAAFVALFALALTGCGQLGGEDAVDTVDTVQAPEPVEVIGAAEPETPPQLNAAVPGLRFLKIGMTIDELKSQDAPMTWSKRSIEGSDYDVAVVDLGPDAPVTAIFDAEGKLYSLETDARAIKDNKGLSTGSTLADLQAAYPEGRLAIGLEEGHYANFLTGGMLLYEFDPEGFDESCFTEAGCEPPGNLKSRKAVLYGQPIP